MHCKMTGALLLFTTKVSLRYKPRSAGRLSGVTAMHANARKILIILAVVVGGGFGSGRNHFAPSSVLDLDRAEALARKPLRIWTESQDIVVFHSASC